MSSGGGGRPALRRRPDGHGKTGGHVGREEAAVGQTDQTDGDRRVRRAQRDKTDRRIDRQMIRRLGHTDECRHRHTPTDRRRHDIQTGTDSLADKLDSPLSSPVHCAGRHPLRRTTSQITSETADRNLSPRHSNSTSTEVCTIHTSQTLRQMATQRQPDRETPRQTNTTP